MTSTSVVAGGSSGSDSAAEATAVWEEAPAWLSRSARVPPTRPRAKWTLRQLSP